MIFLGAGALTSGEVTVILLGLGTLLLTARMLGEIAQRFGQPAVLGELLAGILLGPSLLGAIAPDVFNYLFPKEGNPALFLDGFSVLAISLYLLVAGMEVNLSTVWKQGKAALLVGLAGIIVPFGLGFAAAWFAPFQMGMDPAKKSVLVFALFMATALSISALPVIAKTLMDLNIFKSDFGMIIVAAAIFNDLVGWMIFALILGMMGGTSAGGLSIATVITLTLAFAFLILTVGRWAFNKALPWLQVHTAWPGGILTTALGLALLGAAFTEWIGIHAIFGSFLVGIAIGDSPHMRERTRSILEQFIGFIFAPLFFASVGLRVNFLESFNLTLCLVVLSIACAGKIVGCTIGARLAGMEKKQSLGVGFAMNARGTMEIILGLLALQYGVINQELFVALVVMALVTSMMSGPALQRILRRRKPHRVADYLSAKTFLPELQAGDRRGAIAELTGPLAKQLNMDAKNIEHVVWEREQIIPTGLGEELAVPHARLEGLTKPAVAVGVSSRGVDFDAPDGKPARLIFLLLTPTRDSGSQLDLLAEIGRTFRQEHLRAKVLSARSATEFLALMKTQGE